MQRSEKEKMLAGEYYDATGEVLSNERDRARELTYAYNTARPEEKEKKKEIMKQMIKAKGNFNIEAPFTCDYGYNIQVGDNFYANFGCILLDTNQIIIGDNVLLAPNVQIYTASHPINPIERLSGAEFALPIVIGNNVSIGAGSVVTKDLPDNVVAVGNPCRVIRQL